MKIDAGRSRMAVSGLCPMGPPQSRPSGFVGRGGARERMELSPQAEAEQSGLCSMGPPQSRPSGFVGRGGARERVELSPQAEAEQSGLCSMGPPQSRPSGFVGRGGARERVELSPQAEAEQSGLCLSGAPAKPSLRLCGERRSKGACGAFAAGGSGMKRTLRRRGGVLVSTGVPKQE